MDLSQVTMALLAGGRGTRMGAPKSRLLLRGRPILAWLADRWAWPGPTLLVTAPGFERPPGHDRFDREAVDPVEGAGPLRGLLTALEACGTPTLLVTTVDMPGLESGHFAELSGALDARAGALGVMYRRPAGTACPDEGEIIEPFPSAFRIEALGAVASHLGGGRRSVYSLKDVAGFVVEPAPAWPTGAWSNLNTPADLERFERGCAGPKR